MTTEEKIGQLCFPTGWEMYTHKSEYSVSLRPIPGTDASLASGGLLGQSVRPGPGKLQSGLIQGWRANAAERLQNYT
jgi:beta-glucosidase